MNTTRVFINRKLPLADIGLVFDLEATQMIQRAGSDAKDEANQYFRLNAIPVPLGAIWNILKDIVRHRGRPTLEIRFDENQDLRIYHFPDVGWNRKFGTVHIKNTGNRTGTDCSASLEVVKTPNGVTHLEDQYHVHWADVDYSARTTGAQPVDLRADEQRRLDIVFTQADPPKQGAWIAIPLALSSPAAANQAFLPPGEYLFELVVTCENGSGDGAFVDVLVTKQWEKLQIDITP